MDRVAPGASSIFSAMGPYGVADRSLNPIQWHVSDDATCTPGTTCPAALGGSRMLWCGVFDANHVVKYGYENSTYQILYLDTGAHAVNYTLTMSYQFSSEFNYDYVWFIRRGRGGCRSHRENPPERSDHRRPAAS